MAVLPEVHPDAAELMYPDLDTLFTSYYFTLSEDMLEYENDLWSQLKIESTQEAWIPTTAAVIVGVLLAYLIFNMVRKKVREKRY